MLKLKDISGKTFDKALGFGYKIDDVEEFLREVANDMAEMAKVNSDLEKKLEILAEKLTEYREDEESLRSAILSSQKLGDSVIRESKTKAEIIMRDATIKAESMVHNAHRQIEREHEGLEYLQREVASFKNRLLALYRQHVEIVKSLPGEIDQENRQATRNAASAERVEQQPTVAPLKKEIIESIVEPSGESKGEVASAVLTDDDKMTEREPPITTFTEPTEMVKNIKEAADSITESLQESAMENKETEFNTLNMEEKLRRINIEDDFPQDDSMQGSVATKDKPTTGVSKSQQSKSSIFQKMLDDEDDDYDDEDDEISFFKKSMSDNKDKTSELKFGEAFRIKRNSSFPKFK